MDNSKIRFLTAAGFFFALSASAMADSTTVNISLWDKGQDKPLATNLDLVSMKVMDMHMTNMGVKLSVDKVKAGSVTFLVTNDSKGTIHEMLVIPITDGIQGPAINDKEVKIDEETAGDLGEVAELDPGKNGSLTLELKPGRYLLACNIAGHYMNGMWSLLTVE